MIKRSLRLAIVLGAIAAGAFDGRLRAGAQAVTSEAPSPERAQDQRPPAGSPFSTLPGFRVERVTPTDKTESYIVITFDSLGRPVVSQSTSGSGSSPRVLLDKDGDGIYESEQIISDKINTCHGLFFVGRTLYADCLGRVDGDPENVEASSAGGSAGGAGARGRGQAAGRGRGNANGIPGLYKLTDTNGDDVADTVERVARYINGMGDHGPHAIRRAPDGTINVVIGNNTFIDDAIEDATTTPNFRNMKERQFLPAWRDPRFGNSTKEGTHGTLLRLEEDKKQFAVLFSGLRNTYDFAFTTNGEAFLFDSDMEWDVNAPWYREIATVHVIPGGDYGYRNGTGKFQDDYFDIVPAVRHLRRGSPVGVETYESYAYPTSFFDNLFEADWSRGRLLYTALTPKGATYTGRNDLAEFIHGEPMPITDIEVGPDGNLYFTTGGAAGQGGLYKVTWTGATPPAPDMRGILAVVRQPQPLSSWGWARIEAAKAQLGAAFATQLEQLARNSSAASADRARAVLELQRHGPVPNVALLRTLATDRDPAVRAAAVFAAGLETSDGAKAVAAAALRDTDELVKRRAAEALIRQGLHDASPSFAPVADLYALLNDRDRLVRYAGRLALEHTPRADWAPRVRAETNVVGQTEGLLALIDTSTSAADLTPVFDKVLALMSRANLPVDQKIRVLRTFEIAATATPDGVDPTIRQRVHDTLIGQFPARIDAPAADTYVACAAETPETTADGCQQVMWTHHLAKVLAYTGQPDAIGKILAVMPQGNDDQPGQIDFMYALRVIDTGWTPAEKQQLIAWFGKASKWRGGATFAGQMNNIFLASVDVLTDAEKQLAYDAAPLYAPLTPDEVTSAESGRGAAGGRRGAAPGGRAGAPALPATARAVPLDRQERYDNLVFPRGGGPGSLAGRGGAPDAASGAHVFETACASCHRFGSMGSATGGPDLTGIGTRMLRRDVLRAIFFPSEKVDPQYATTVITTRDHRTVRGLVVGEDNARVTLKTADAPEPIAVQKSDIASRTTEATSIMPADLVDQIGNDRSIADVVAYLMNGSAR
jgi:putative heme-binding domain-containing protein